MQHGLRWYHLCPVGGADGPVTIHPLAGTDHPRREVQTGALLLANYEELHMTKYELKDMQLESVTVPVMTRALGATS